MIIFDIVSKTTELKFFTDKDLKNLNEAKKYLDIAIKLELDDILSLILLLRGRIKLHSGDIEGGRQDIYKAYELCPNEDEFSDLILEVANCTFRKYFGYEYLELLNESISEIQKRNLLKIKKDLNFAIKLDKNNISAYFIRGIVNKLLNNKEGSSRDFEIIKNKDAEDDFAAADAASGGEEAEVGREKRD